MFKFKKYLQNFSTKCKLIVSNKWVLFDNLCKVLIQKKQGNKDPPLGVVKYEENKIQ